MSVGTRVAGRLAIDAPARRRSPLPLAICLTVAPALALALALLLLPVLTHDPVDPSPLPRAVASATSPYAFDLAGWEVGALVDGIGGRARAAFTLPALGEAAQRDLVLQYYDAVAEANRSRGEMDAAHAPGSAGRGEPRIADLEQRWAGAERRRAALAPAAIEITSRQINAYLAGEGLAGVPLQPVWRFTFPPLTFTITPPVFFRFAHLPLLLVVAPRDRIEVLDGVFLQPTLPAADWERLEDQIDRHGVASLVLPIGGFAAYPSMIPDSSSPRQTLPIVAHEWVHQYLAMRPLGQRYFASYPLRSINETVADLAGKEIGEAVLQRYYSPAEPPSVGLPVSENARPVSYFNWAMAEIRRTVEAMLARGDVDGAERYMAERRGWLEQNGYRLRKLNTAYLTFYGAYAGAGNNYEPKLRLLRARSGSLAEFLHRVETIAGESDFAALPGE